jgi:hypothetical protein
MHVYKFLEPRGWAPNGEGLVTHAVEAPEMDGVDVPGAEVSPGAKAFQPGAQVESASQAKGPDWHKRPPGWALRREGSALTLIEE